MLGIRWSDEYQEELVRKQEIKTWYDEAIHSLKQGKATLLGKPINPMNHEEVVAFLYLWGKDYRLFHEEL